MARWVATALRNASVSSVAPSPFSPSDRMFTQVSRGGRSGRSEGTGGGSAAIGAALNTSLIADDFSTVTGPASGSHSPWANVFTRYVSPGAATFLWLSRNAANTGTRLQIASSKLISVRGFAFSEIITAGPETSSKRPSLTQSSSCDWSSIEIADGSASTPRHARGWRFPLAFEGRVHQCELPPRRRRLRPGAVLP